MTRGEGRRAVAAARRLPAPGQGRPDHLPRRRRAELALPPTSVGRGRRRPARRAAHRRPHPARRRACCAAAELLRVERLRDPQRRPLLVVVTDGRATAGRATRSTGRAGPRGCSPRPAPPRRRRLRVRPGPARPGRRASPRDLRRRPPCALDELRRRRRSPRAVRQRHRDEEGGLMPQGKPEHVPDDGLTTRQRRNRPLLVVHTGTMKGKSTAAFGLALRALEPGLADRGVPVRQERRSGRSARRRALRALGGCTSRPARAARSPGTRWARAGPGSSAAGHRARPRRRRRRGLGADQARPGRRDATGFYVLDEFTYPMKWGWVDVDEVVATLRGPARHPARRHHRPGRRTRRWSRPPTWSPR